MAEQKIVEWVDDLTGDRIEDGERRTPTVPFGLEGVRYEIDLTEKNRAEFEELLRPYIAAARKVPKQVTSSRVQPPPRKPAKVDQEQLRQIRRWGQENAKALGLKPPSDKGRIPDAVMEAYRKHDGKKVRRRVPPAFAS